MRHARWLDRHHPYSPYLQTLHEVLVQYYNLTGLVVVTLPAMCGAPGRTKAATSTDLTEVFTTGLGQEGYVYS